MIIPTTTLRQVSVIIPVGGVQTWLNGVPTHGTCSCGQPLMVVEDPYGIYGKRFRCPNPKFTGCP